MKIQASAAVAAMLLFAGNARAVEYFEASLGAAFIPTLDTKKYTFTDPSTGDVYSGNGFLNYGTAMTAGAEFGYAGLDSNNVRVGLGWDYIHAMLDNAGVVGTLNGAPGTYTVPANVVKAAGFNFNNAVHVFSANGYYNLPLIGETIRPYVGAGLGAALIEHADTQLAASATVGVRYALSEDFYLGAKYRFYYITGPTDSLGIQYKPILAHTVSLVLGAYAD